MPFQLATVAIPAFGASVDQPAIPADIYARRADAAYAKAACDWLVIYGDLEHCANITFLCGYDPRFEEALLCLGPAGKRILIVGNEGGDYAKLAGLPELDVVLAQSFSLPGMDRLVAPRLVDVLRAIGLRAGTNIGLAGWKPLYAHELDDDGPSFLVPHSIVKALAKAAGGMGAISDKTSILMDPVEGLRAVNDVHQIAQFEWAATRAGDGVRRIVETARPGMSEHTAMLAMHHTGEPLTCRSMFSASADTMIGLKSPGNRIIRHGDAVTTAIGYRGGLASRAGLMVEHDEDFLTRFATPYFEAQALWCEMLAIGRPGGDIEAAISEALERAGLRSAFTPGHLGGHEEWLHSTTTPGNRGCFRSGALIQCDIIPTPMPRGTALNCEDPLILADHSLRKELSEIYPDVHARLVARQDFVRNTLGIAISDDYLPLSNWPHCFPPFWLRAHSIFRRT
jgi:hypothetical protein